jgi:hypothetical protein
MAVARVQNNGLARITTAMVALSWWLQWGTGTNAAATANVVTTTSTTEARASATASQQTTTVANDTMRLIGTITELSTGPVAITEVGAFDAAGTGGPATGGNMDIYGDFAAINVSLGDSIAFTINTKFS